MKEGVVGYIKEQFNTVNEIAEIVAQTSKISRSDAILIGLTLFASSVPAMAQTKYHWENFCN